MKTPLEAGFQKVVLAHGEELNVADDAVAMADVEEYFKDSYDGWTPAERTALSAVLPRQLGKLLQLMYANRHGQVLEEEEPDAPQRPGAQVQAGRDDQHNVMPSKRKFF